jgi:hypothetical protein
MSSTQDASQWRFLITPKWLGWHLLVIVSILGMLWLGDWQLHRAEAGNALSWAYTFEWPMFAIFALVFWGKTIRDEVHPPAEAESTDAVGLPGGAPVAPPASATRNSPPTTPTWPASPRKSGAMAGGMGSGRQQAAMSRRRRPGRCA